MRTYPIAFVAVVACGGGGPPSWDKQPLETMSGSIGGKDFTIALPKGSRQSKVDSKYSVEFNYHADRNGEDYVFAPSVMIGWNEKHGTLANALEHQDAKHKPVSQEESATGWAYAVENDAYPGREDYVITAETYLGDSAFSCNVRIFPMKKGGTTKELIPQATAICKSIKAK
jgi:hypothetical protein